MKKIYSMAFALIAVFGVFGISSAASPVAGPGDLGQLVSPGSYSIGNSTSAGTLLSSPSLVTDDYLFEVNLPSSFGAAVTTISISTTGAWTSFNTSLSVWTGSWNEIASNTGSQPFSPDDDTWMSSLLFSPLSASPTEYKLTVSGSKLDGPAGYGGNISVSPVTPVPEPEIYAMLAAGLGLMGFVARRRKQHDDAVA